MAAAESLLYAVNTAVCIAVTRAIAPILVNTLDDYGCFDLAISEGNAGKTQISNV